MSERKPIKAEEAQEAPEWLLEKPHLCDDGTCRAHSIGSPHGVEFGEFKAPDEGWNNEKTIMSEDKATYGEKEWQVGDTALFCGKEVTVIQRAGDSAHYGYCMIIGWFDKAGHFQERRLPEVHFCLLKPVDKFREPPRTITDAAGQTWIFESSINDAIGPEDTMMFQNTYKKRGQDVWEKPLYKHDCESCIFLGRFNGDDLYFHRSPLLHAHKLLSRHSNIDSDYEGYSYLVGKVWTHDIPVWWKEAVSRARERGLLND